jgi:hypothetical protein
MTPKLDDLLPTIRHAGDSGLSFEVLRKRFAGRSKGSVTELREMLDALVRKGALRRPGTDGTADHYIAAERARPTGKPRLKRPGVAKPPGLLAAITAAGDAGLTPVELRTRSAGRTKAGEPALREELAALGREGLIRVLNDGTTDHYFAAGRGPSGHTVSAVVVSLVRESGLTLSTAATLAQRLGALDRLFLDEAIAQALRERAIVQLIYGTTQCYLHCEVAAGLLPASRAPSSAPARITLQEILPVYRRLRAEQGGFSGVRIFDLMKAMSLPKELLHPVLLDEAKAGRITIHRSASVELPRQVSDAGIRLPGFPDPFVTFAVKKD